MNSKYELQLITNNNKNIFFKSNKSGSCKCSEPRISRHAFCIKILTFNDFENTLFSVVKHGHGEYDM